MVEPGRVEVGVAPDRKLAERIRQKADEAGLRVNIEPIQVGGESMWLVTAASEEEAVKLQDLIVTIEPWTGR